MIKVISYILSVLIDKVIAACTTHLIKGNTMCTINFDWQNYHCVYKKFDEVPIQFLPNIMRSNTKILGDKQHHYFYLFWFWLGVFHF